jgi:hypothetical protein
MGTEKNSTCANSSHLLKPKPAAINSHGVAARMMANAALRGARYDIYGGERFVGQ